MSSIFSNRSENFFAFERHRILWFWQLSLTTASDVCHVGIVSMAYEESAGLEYATVTQAIVFDEQAALFIHTEDYKPCEQQ